MYQKLYRQIIFNVPYPDKACFRRPASDKLCIICDWDDCLYDKASGKVNKNLLCRLIGYRQRGYYIELSTARGRRRSGNAWNATVQNIVVQEIASELLGAGIANLFDSVSIGFKAFAEVYIDDKAENCSME